MANIFQLTPRKEIRYMSFKQSSSENTALIFASHEGHEAVVRLLLSRGDIDVNAVDKVNSQKTLPYARNNLLFVP